VHFFQLQLQRQAVVRIRLSVVDSLQQARTINVRNGAIIQRSGPARSGFTLIELLVVIAIIAILAAILMPVLNSAQESSLRANCANNLHEIGVGVNIYANDNNDYLPQEDWPQGDNPWETDQICRAPTVGTSQISQGPYGLGLMFFGGQIKNPRVFYCPSVQSGEYNFSTYEAPGYPWPSIPPGYNASSDDYVRCGYNYYPEPKTRELISGDDANNVSVPALTYQNQSITFSVQNPPGGPQQSGLTEPILLKTTQLDQSKAMTVDLIKDWKDIGHKHRGQPFGATALFGDGHALFQSMTGKNVKGSCAPFDPKLWDPLDSGGLGPGNDPVAFRVILNGFMP
jgi:prepilin-type N-terminal cleavage/methylation domain-containing protein